MLKNAIILGFVAFAIVGITGCAGNPMRANVMQSGQDPVTGAYYELREDGSSKYIEADDPRVRESMARSAQMTGVCTTIYERTSVTDSATRRCVEDATDNYIAAPHNTTTSPNAFGQFGESVIDGVAGYAIADRKADAAVEASENIGRGIGNSGARVNVSGGQGGSASSTSSASQSQAQEQEASAASSSSSSSSAAAEASRGFNDY